MGWASAGNIFEPVAEALIDLDAPYTTITGVLIPLIKVLLRDDWDTEEESLRMFQDHDAVVDAFAQCGVYLTTDPRHVDYEYYRSLDA